MSILNNSEKVLARAQSKIESGAAFSDLTRREQKLYGEVLTKQQQAIEEQAVIKQTAADTQSLAENMVIQNTQNNLQNIVPQPPSQQTTPNSSANDPKIEDPIIEQPIWNKNNTTWVQWQNSINQTQTPWNIAESVSNSVDGKLANLESQIVEMRKQLRAIWQHSNTIDRKYLRQIRNILTDAKKHQIDVNQRYSEWITNKEFKDIRTPDEVESMLCEIENKIALARQAWSAVLTGHWPSTTVGTNSSLPWWSTTPNAWNQGINTKVLCNTIDYRAWVTENDNTKTALMKMIHNSEALSNIWPNGWAIIKTIGKLAVAGFGLFTIYKGIRSAIKWDRKSAIGRWLWATVFYGMAPKKILDMMGVEANNIFGGLKWLKWWGSNSPSNFSLSESSNSILNTTKEDLTGPNAVEKKQDLIYKWTMLTATPFCDLTFGELQWIVQYNGSEIQSIDYAKARALLNQKYGTGGGEFINALNLLETSDKHAKTLWINIVAEWFKQLNIDASALNNPTIQDKKVIERVKDVSDSIWASNDLIKFYSLRNRLEKNPNIKAYFDKESGSFERFANQILELPEETRTAILSGNIKFDIENQSGRDYLVIQDKNQWIILYLDLFSPVTTDNKDHKNQIWVRNKEGKIIFFDWRFSNYKNMIQGAYCLGKIMNKLRWNARTTHILQQRWGRKWMIRKDLVTADGKSVITEEELPEEMKGAYMPDFTKFLDGELSSRMSHEYKDVHGITNQLQNAGFKPERLISQLSSTINQIAIDNLIWWDISVEYAALPDDPSHKVLYINTFWERNAVFIDINNNNPETSIIKVWHKDATTPWHILWHTFTEGDVNANGGIKWAMGLALLFGQCSAVKATHHSSDPNPWHWSGDQLEYSYGNMTRSAYRWMTWLASDKFSNMFDDKKSSIALKNWIPTLFDPTIFSKSADGNKTALTNFLNGWKVKTKNAQGQEVLKNYWDEDERVRSSSFVNEMKEAIARSNEYALWPAKLDPKDTKSYAAFGINPNKKYIRQINTTDYAGLDTREMIQVSRTDNGYRYNHVSFQPSDKQIWGKMGVPVATDMISFLNTVSGYLGVKSSEIAYGTQQVLTTLGNDGKNIAVNIYKGTKEVAGDVTDAMVNVYQDTKSAIKVVYPDGKEVIRVGYKWLKEVTQDLANGAELVYNYGKEISKDAVQVLMYTRRKVFGTTIDANGQISLNAVTTLKELNDWMKVHLGINLPKFVKTIMEKWWAALEQVSSILTGILTTGQSAVNVANNIVIKSGEVVSQVTDVIKTTLKWAEKIIRNTSNKVIEIVDSAGKVIKSIFNVVNVVISAAGNIVWRFDDGWIPHMIIDEILSFDWADNDKSRYILDANKPYTNEDAYMYNQGSINKSKSSNTPPAQNKTAQWWAGNTIR